MINIRQKALEESEKDSEYRSQKLKRKKETMLENAIAKLAKMAGITSSMEIADLEVEKDYENMLFVIDGLTFWVHPENVAQLWANPFAEEDLGLFLLPPDYWFDSEPTLRERQAQRSPVIQSMSHLGYMIGMFEQRLTQEMKMQNQAEMA